MFVSPLYFFYPPNRPFPRIRGRNFRNDAIDGIDGRHIISGVGGLDLRSSPIKRGRDIIPRSSINKEGKIPTALLEATPCIHYFI